MGNVFSVIFLVLHKGRKAPLHFSTDCDATLHFSFDCTGFAKEVQTLATVSFQSCKIVHQETTNVTPILLPNVE